MNKKSEKAAKLFNDGYNCAQSVLGAFHKEIGMSFEEALKLASSLSFLDAP